VQSCKKGEIHFRKRRNLYIWEWLFYLSVPFFNLLELLTCQTSKVQKIKLFVIISQFNSKTAYQVDMLFLLLD
jgi:hypothetical protein